MADDGNAAAAGELVTVELPAPPGWKKTFTPKSGRASKRNEIVFISPTGEEINNKKQLDQYLRSHPGGPPSSDFDWGTGDTPRRSARISGKAKAVAIAEDELPKKKGKRTPTKKEDKQKKAIVDGDDETPSIEDDDAKSEVKQKEAIVDRDDKTPAVEDDDGKSGEKEPADLEMKDAGEDSAGPDAVENPGDDDTHDNAEIKGDSANQEVEMEKPQESIRGVAEIEEDSTKQEAVEENPVKNIESVEIEEDSTKADEVGRALPNIHNAEVKEDVDIKDGDNTEGDNNGSAKGNTKEAVETLEPQLEVDKTETGTVETVNDESAGDSQIAKAEDRLSGKEVDYNGPPGNGNHIDLAKEVATMSSNHYNDDNNQKQVPEASPPDC